MKCPPQWAGVKNVSQASDLEDCMLVPSTKMKAKGGKKRLFDCDGEKFVLFL